MTTSRPAWAEEVTRRYLRGEASVFVLYGNVHDAVLHDGALVGISDFLSRVVLEKKSVVVQYNVSTGCRFLRKATRVDDLEELLTQRSADKVLPALERMLLGQDNVAVVVDYAEMIAPAGDATFFSAEDRFSVVTLQRWSLSPELEARDNLVVLLCESLGDLNPKIVAHPRVAAIPIPMPSLDERHRIVQRLSPALDTGWTGRLAEVTAGLKVVQIKGILSPPQPHGDDHEAHFRFLLSLVGDEARARKLAAVTQGMSRDEVSELIGAKPSPPPRDDKEEEFSEILRHIAKKKREIIERECFGLIEFVEPAHDFSVVGGIDEVKRELLGIAKNIRESKHSRVPMGLLFTGPMGTGKTFVAEAFVKESGLTGIKLKNFRSKWVGATESNLERILGVVQAIGHVIVIIDEGDRSFGSGGEDGDGGTSSRVVARLKEFMSDTSHRGRVLFVLMTNRPDKLDIDIKRAGRLDRKIPFLQPQTAEDIERVLEAQFRKHKLKPELVFPRDRDTASQRLVGYSNAELEAVALLAHDYAANLPGEGVITREHFQQAATDYLPSRDVEMLEYMELLAVFEASNRRMLPAKYASMTLDELQTRLATLALRCAGRR